VASIRIDRRAALCRYLDLRAGFARCDACTARTSALVLVTSLYSDYFWYTYLVIPAYALFLLWTKAIWPWITQPSVEVPPPPALRGLALARTHPIAEACTVLPIVYL
jgi:hypothetical protein